MHACMHVHAYMYTYILPTYICPRGITMHTYRFLRLLASLVEYTFSRELFRGENSKIGK